MQRSHNTLHGYPCYLHQIVFIRKLILNIYKFPIRKSAILGKLKEIKGLYGDIRIVCRTRNPAD